MKWISKVSPLIKEVELRKSPVIITVNKFDEKSAKEFQQQMAQAHNTGQKIIPVVIDSYGGQVYSLMSMISAIKHAELPVATIVEGNVMWCDSFFFWRAGSKVYGSRFYPHDTRRFFDAMGQSGRD